MEDYLATGERRKEAGSRKREEEEEVDDYLATGERRKEAGSRKREEVEDYLITGIGNRKQKAERGKRRRK